MRALVALNTTFKAYILRAIFFLLIKLDHCIAQHQSNFSDAATKCANTYTGNENLLSLWRTVRAVDLLAAAAPAKSLWANFNRKSALNAYAMQS